MNTTNFVDAETTVIHGPEAEEQRFVIEPECEARISRILGWEGGLGGALAIAIGLFSTIGLGGLIATAL